MARRKAPAEETTQIRPEDRVLDWHRRFDKRSLNFKIAAVAPQIMTKPARSRTWTRGAWLDQGVEGACTGFGLAHAVAATPRAQSMTEDMARQFYYEARRNDEWPGENYDGSSVLGAMQAGRKYGFLSEYLWATTPAEIVAGITNYGPMEIGVDWYTGMFYPDPETAIIEPTGVIEGGHALAADKVALRWKEGVSAAQKKAPDWFDRLDQHETLVRLEQSWGRAHGQDGFVFVRLSTITERLLPQRGEFALPRKVKPAR